MSCYQIGLHWKERTSSSTITMSNCVLFFFVSVTGDCLLMRNSYRAFIARTSTTPPPPPCRHRFDFGLLICIMDNWLAIILAIIILAVMQLADIILAVMQLAVIELAVMQLAVIELAVIVCYRVRVCACLWVFVQGMCIICNIIIFTVYSYYCGIGLSESVCGNQIRYKGEGGRVITLSV